MAVNLQVVLTLDDRLSNQIRNANRRINETERQVNSLDSRLTRVKSGLGKTQAALSRFGSSGSNSIMGVNKSLIGLLSTIGATKLAMDGLTSVIAESAKFEQSQVVIDALFNDEAASKSYMDMVTKMAVNSPILDSSAMLDNSMPFLTITKSVPQLEKAWGVVEKLSLTNPGQGVEGAVIALKELQSGDVVSLSERFNISKKVLNKIKDLSFSEQLASLEKYMNGIGLTDAAVEKMGNTTTSQFTKLKESATVMLREIGSSSNTELGKALTSINDMLSEGKFQPVIDSMQTLLGKAATKISEFVATADWEAISANIIGAFNKINEAINWAVEHWDQIKNAVKWATIIFLGFKAVSVVISVISGIISVISFLTNAFKLAKTAFSILRLSMLAFPGAWIIGAIMLVVGIFVLLYEKCEWFREFWDEAWDFAVESAEWAVNNIIDGVNAIISAINSIPLIEIDTVGGVDFNGDGKQKGANKTTKAATKKKKSHSGGLSRVPYDGYGATLHKGERVLTKTEANNYESGAAGGKSVSVSFAGANFNVRSDSDVEQIANTLATKIMQSMNKGA